MSFRHVRGDAQRRSKPGISSSTRDEIEGAARTAAGIIKEETGKALKNPELEAEGNADQFVGNTQTRIGKIKKALGA